VLLVIVFVLSTGESAAGVAFAASQPQFCSLTRNLVSPKIPILVMGAVSADGAPTPRSINTQPVSEILLTSPACIFEAESYNAANPIRLNAGHLAHIALQRKIAVNRKMTA
jgi:hypothetical protein